MVVVICVCCCNLCSYVCVVFGEVQCIATALVPEQVFCTIRVLKTDNNSNNIVAITGSDLPDCPGHLRGSSISVG